MGLEILAEVLVFLGLVLEADVLAAHAVAWLHYGRLDFKSSTSLVRVALDWASERTSSDRVLRVSSILSH